MVTNQSIKNRLEALEARETPPVLYIWRECGESAAAATKREGVKAGRNVVVYYWRDGGCGRAGCGHAEGVEKRTRLAAGGEAYIAAQIEKRGLNFYAPLRIGGGGSR